MSEAAERVEAWRRAKRKEGLRPVTLWLSLECKSELDTLAYKRQQDVSACVMEAVHHFAVAQGARKTPRLDQQDLHYLKEEIYADVVRRLGTHASAALALPTPPPSPVPARVGKAGVPPETIVRICAERKKYPELSLHQLGIHLFDTGIYRATEKRTGQPVPAQGAFLKNLFDRAKRLGLLS
jgi:hypothetical protein